MRFSNQPDLKDVAKNRAQSVSYQTLFIMVSSIVPLVLPILAPVVLSNKVIFWGAGCFAGSDGSRQATELF